VTGRTLRPAAAPWPRGAWRPGWIRTWSFSECRT